MDGLDDGPSCIRQISQNDHDLSSSVRIKTCGRLVQKDQGWVGDELDTDRSSFSFSARYSLNQSSSDEGVLTLVQFEVHDNFVNFCDLLGSCPW